MKIDLNKQLALDAYENAMHQFNCTINLEQEIQQHFSFSKK